MKRALLTLSLALAAIFAHAQLSDWQNYNAVSWVRKIVADGEDGLWIATDGGLLRYDIKSGKTVFYNRANTGIADNNMLGLCVDGGDLWMGSRYYGVGRMRDGRVTTYNMANSGLQSNQAFTEIVSVGGKLYFAGLLGFYEFDGSKFRFFNAPGSEISPNINYNAAAVDSKGRVWFGGSDVMGQCPICYLNERGEIVAMDFANDITDMLFDEDGNLWLATSSSGLVRYDGKATFFNTSNSNIPSNFINAIAHDAVGNLWLGTEKGLVRFDGSDFSLTAIPLGDNDWITAICVDGARKWIGTRRSGMFLLENDECRCIALTELPFCSNLMSAAATFDSDGNLYIGAADCFLKYSADRWSKLFEGQESYITPCRIADAVTRDDGRIVVAFNKSDTLIAEFSAADTTYITMQNRDPNFIIKRLKIAPDQSIWMATNSGLYHLIDGAWERFSTQNAPMKFNDILSLHIDDDGTVWCGAFQSGLLRYDGHDWTVEMHQRNDDNSLPTNNILDIERDTNGRLWVSAGDDTGAYNIVRARNAGRGIAYCENGRWTNFDIWNSDIASNTVQDIEFAPNGDLWMATYGDAGLCLLTPDGRWQTYNVTNSGIAHNDIQRLAIDQRHSRLWLIHDNFSGLSSATYLTTMTAIPSIHVDTHPEAIYTLQGHRLSSPPNHGLFIHNGKKIVGR